MFTSTLIRYAPAVKTASRRVDILDHGTRRPVARPELAPVGSIVSSKEKERHERATCALLPWLNKQNSSQHAKHGLATTNNRCISRTATLTHTQAQQHTILSMKGVVRSYACYVFRLLKTLVYDQRSQWLHAWILQRNSAPNRFPLWARVEYTGGKLSSVSKRSNHDRRECWRLIETYFGT